jgi:two-component system sensor histidine kinase/response regulator
MLTSVNVWLAGFFACAALHYAIHWWGSRAERVLLVFSVQCAAYTVFCLTISSYFAAKTIADCQLLLDRFITIGVLIHALTLQLYAYMGSRRDHAFRALSTGTLLFLAVLHQWVPLRGMVTELKAVQLPAGFTTLVPIRTPPSRALVLLYVTVLVDSLYGFFVARGIWRRDRIGAALVGGAAMTVSFGAGVAFLVDFASWRMPYLGAWPHMIFVLCMTLFLSREYSARGARVAATQRQFKAAFEHAPIGMALLALNGRVVGVNRALTRILGWTAEELCARRLAQVTHEDDGDEPQLERLREVPAYTVEKRFVRKDGEPVWGLLAVSAVPDEHGKVTRIIAQMQDVTELRAHRERLEDLVATRTREFEDAKDEAERASRAKSEFLAHISHEIRTPLHIMLAHAQGLAQDPRLGEAQRAKIAILGSSGKHLRTLINDVLEMSKIEAGRPELVESAFDPRATLVEVERMFAAEAAFKGIELSIEHAPELPSAVLGDSAKIKQILINLSSNALKFTRRGSITLRAASSRLADGSVLVETVVADTGIGIAPEEAERIFQPFEQLEEGRRAGGTGLGLPISLAYARLMGGDIRVESAAGAGSAFKFTYVAKCVALDAAAIRHEAARVEPGVPSCKVLIVDDVALNRDLLSEYLSGRGFETRAAEDGADALSIHAAWQPDLVLIDLRMHGMGGLEAIRRMRDAGSSAAIGALSASALEEDERLALAIGADFFLRKPYDYSDLLDEISRVLVSADQWRNERPEDPRVAF